MIRMIQSTSVHHAKSYFNDALSKSDYYITDQEKPGTLHGRLSERLGLESNLDKNIFHHLCENTHPQTGDRLTLRTKENRTIGYDINFHSPKSVSILQALTNDDHIADAFQSSVNQVMKMIEADAETRVRKGRRQEDRLTGELIWAEFLHHTARPTDDSPPDPHLHIHAYVFNMTWDESEKQIKAGQFRNIKRDMPYYQSLFHKILSDNLINLGYKIRRTSQSFEIEGIPQNVIDLFSKRTNAIGQYAKENNITSKKQLDKLGAITRSKKQKGLSMPELKMLWKDQIRNLDTDVINDNNVIRTTTHNEPPKTSAKDCIDYAIKHSFERASTIQERRFLESALKHGIGDATIPSTSILDSATNDPRLVRVQDNNRTHITTQEVLKEEREMIRLAKNSQGKCLPLYNTLPVIDLEGQQSKAVSHILTTSDRVSIIMGAAGTGKTTILKSVEKLIDQVGKKLQVVAPTAEASKGVLVADGFENATTVAKLLTDKDLQAHIAGQILWVDEAGLLGTSDMHSLLALAEDQNCQIIFGGDTRQHSSVVRGDALRILAELGGIKVNEVNKIIRQKDNDYRGVVEDLSKACVQSAFLKLETMGAIHEDDDLNANDQLAEDYTTLLKKGRSALVVSPTHKQGRAITNLIRKKMREKGMLGKGEVVTSQYINLNLSIAEKSDYGSYMSGQFVQFNQNLKGCGRGSLWSVDSVDQENIVIANEKEGKRILPLKDAEKFDVYQKSEIAISKGDKIKITKNGFDTKKNRLNNGQTLEVHSIEKKGIIKLRNALSKKIYELDIQYGHIAHAHCITSYAAQGKTVDHVLISQPSSTFGATDARQLYVSVSRGRESVTIYTDDKISLLENASRLGNRQSAVELLVDNKLALHFN